MDRPAIAPEVWAGRITPLVLTFNESPNIARCLARLAWAARVVVLDSGSTDDTVALARRFPNADVQVRAFDDHASQWNHGLGLVATPWVLSLDADYVLPADFIAALAGVPDDDLAAVNVAFRYCIRGRPLRGSLYPPRPVLFRRDRCHYETDGHTQRLVVAGRTADLAARIDHDDRKPHDRWLASQANYARLEAAKLSRTPWRDLTWPDRLRKTIVLAPLGVPVYTLVIKGTLLDGWPGWVYAYQRTVAEMILSWQLLKRWFR